MQRRVRTPSPSFMAPSAAAPPHPQDSHVRPTYSLFLRVDDQHVGIFALTVAVCVFPGLRRLGQPIAALVESPPSFGAAARFGTCCGEGGMAVSRD